ncbi:MAG: hypothetical protein KDA79_02540, partial [Planctomycetaceae bacterium]|nr:hypothetical protein [Planctomycetaceae bacterium]
MTASLLLAVSCSLAGPGAVTRAAESAAPRVATEAPQIRCAVANGLLLSIEPSPADPTRVLVRLQHEKKNTVDARQLALRLLRKGEATAGEPLPSMGGKRTVEPAVVTFRPVVPLVRGRTYRAEYRPPGIAGPESAG